MDTSIHTVSMFNSLFDEYERVDLDPAKQGEPKFEYLNRSARPTFVRVRELMDEWFRAIPVEHRDDLRARFRADREDSHFGAFFELYCHAILRAHGFSITIHPSMAGERSTSPDFLVCRGEDQLFYFEATHAMPTRDDQANDARNARLEDEINKMELADFFVCTSVLEAGTSSPSWAGFRRFITDHADRLDPDDIAACRAARSVYRKDDWAIEFWFVPKRPEARGKNGSRPLGMTTPPASFVSPQDGIKSSLKKKATKYGKLDLPYVIAVNCLHDFLDNEDVMAALFGDVEYVVTPGKGVSEVRRCENGFWRGPKGYQNQRVSAVLVADQLVPWTIGSGNPGLWCNPFASHPFNSKLWQCNQYVLNNETQDLERRTGIAMPDLLESRHISQAIADEKTGTS